MITKIDSLTAGRGDLALITELNELGRVQLFIHIDATTTCFHIIDECGHYLSQSTETYELQGHLHHLHHFVQNIARRLQLAGQSGAALPVTFYQLIKSSAGAWQPREVALNIDPEKKVTDIHALAMPAASGGQALSILFQGEEFSSLEWGAELYQEVAQQVLDRRQPGATYPIYITDVELAQPVSGEPALQSIHYFKYKNPLRSAWLPQYTP
jgi:adenylate cyclase class 1